MPVSIAITLYVLCLMGGFILLIWSADKFIMGATTIAVYARISPLIIGIVIVGFATSAPEYLVSLLAVINGSIGISFGNILGSNITNIGLGVGLPALFAPLALSRDIAKKELPLLLISTILALVLLYKGHFSRIDALLLLCIFFSAMLFSIWSTGKKQQHVSKKEEYTPQISKLQAILWLCIGLILLISASQILVYSSIKLAQILGISDLIIGLTIIAIGTSLPEIASSCLAVIRGESDIALGNIIGSNIFNLFLVLGTVGVIKPTDIPIEVITRDGIAMLLMTAMFFLYSLGKKPYITRTKGIILLCMYSIYLFIVILTELGSVTL